MNSATLTIVIILILFLLLCIIYRSFKIGCERGYLESCEKEAIIRKVIIKTLSEFLTEKQIEKFFARLRANLDSEITELKFHKNRDYERNQ